VATFNLDDTAENQDWTKAREFDLPLGDRQFLEFQLGLSSDPVQRQQRLMQLAQLPIANDAAPKWLLAELDAAMRTAMLKGDYVGHPFRGNQWMDESGVGRGGAGSSPDQDRQAYEMRQAGQTWEAIAASLGYANGGAVRRLAVRHEERLRTEGVRADPQPLPPEPRTEPTSPRTGYVNGLPRPSSDQNVAAQEGRPLAGWVKFSPAIQARLDARDRWAERNAVLEHEAVVIRDKAIKTMDEADSKHLLRLDGSYLVGWAAERDAAFAQRVENHRAELKNHDVNVLVSDMQDELIEAAGFRPRSEAEKAEIRAAKLVLDDYKSPKDERAAAESRLAREQLTLTYSEESRQGKGGRLEQTDKNFRVSAYSRERDADLAKEAFNRQVLVRYDIKGLLDQGYTEQQIGEIYGTARGVAADRTYTPTFLAVTRGGSLTAAEILPQQLEAVAEIEGPLKTSNVTITMPPRVLAQVLNDGRYKTQFETRRSGGLNDPQARSKEEAERFGYPTHMKPEFRPVYGMVELGGVQAPSERDNLQYGSAVIVLKPETRERTTFTTGDSLSLNRPSAPVMNPRAQPAVVGIDKDTIMRESVFREDPRKIYLEAQIHGGVRTSDIASVIFEVGAEIVGTGTRDEGQIIGTTKPPSRSVLAALDKAGIPYQIITKPEEIVQPVTKLAKRGFLPWVMLKGDFVGHPFRGNQWSDASGAAASTTGASSAPPDPDRLITDRQARTIAAGLMDKMDIVAAAGAVIKIGEPTREVRAVYNDQLETKASSAQLRTRQQTLVLNGINTTEEALNDEGTIVVITDRDNQIVGAMSMDEEPEKASILFSSKNSWHPLSDVVQPKQKFMQMKMAGSTGQLDGVGSTLFGQAVLHASRQGSGLYLTPLNQTAIEFWESVGFKTEAAGQEFTTYQYLDAGSVKAIADNLDDPMETK